MAQNLLDKSSVKALESIAVDAGRAIMEIYNKPEDWGVEMKADDSPLTQADLQANDIIVTGLTKLAPDIPVLSEESPWCGGQAATYWAVDPLDGTKEFIKRNGEFTVNIALVENGVPVLGLVHAPVLQQTWLGIVKGLEPCSGPVGAFLLEGDKRIAIQSVGLPESKPVRVVASRSHPSPELQTWLSQFHQGVELVEKGSSLKLCLVAQGLAHVYPRFGPTCIWDTAAGHAVLLAAGGSVQVVEPNRSIRPSDSEKESQGVIGNSLSLRYLDPSQTLNPYFVAWG
jgi:3'(2'), 5'-bisphosphate nucleotidase